MQLRILQRIILHIHIFFTKLKNIIKGKVDSCYPEIKEQDRNNITNLVVAKKCVIIRERDRKLKDVRRDEDPKEYDHESFCDFYF